MLTLLILMIILAICEKTLPAFVDAYVATLEYKGNQSKKTKKKRKKK